MLFLTASNRGLRNVFVVVVLVVGVILSICLIWNNGCSKMSIWNVSCSKMFIWHKDCSKDLEQRLFQNVNLTIWHNGCSHMFIYLAQWLFKMLIWHKHYFKLMIWYKNCSKMVIWHKCLSKMFMLLFYILSKLFFIQEFFKLSKKCLDSNTC